MSYLRAFFFLFIITTLILNKNNLYSQQIDPDEFLDRLDRIERNISDLQKGLMGSIEDNLTSGYISRNETRLDEVETKNQENYGLFEQLENKLLEIEKKLDLINNDISIRFEDIEDKIIINKKNFPVLDQSAEKDEVMNKEEVINEIDKVSENIDPKLKYENAIKLLWSNKLDEALEELIMLKKIKPQDLMPNIQYWLGEVHYAKKDFNQAILEFGEGLKNYPDSIKGPDNMLKLGLSFSNLNNKNDACNVFIELELKYPDASKDVIQRSIKERNKLDCPKE